MSAWLYTQLRYINPNRKKSDPTMRWAAEMKNFDSVNLADTYPTNAVLFTGSSYIRLWKNIREDVKYPSIIHRGYGGSNLTEMAYYVKRIVYPHQPAALFMYVGNDITGSEKDKTPIQVLELFKYVAKTIRDKYPELPIVWLPIAPSPKRWMVWNEVQEANRLIEAYCAGEYRLYTVNASAKYLGKDGKPLENLFVEDRLHYNEKGYQLWGKEIKKLVHQLASGRLP
jgi:lysophospholipase L1-like esterase